MSTPISTDLRARIVAAFRKGQTSTVQLARRFAVSQPSVWRLLKRFKDEKTIKPRPHGGGQPAMLSEKDLQMIQHMVDRQPELTAQDISKKLGPRLGRIPSSPVIWRALGKLGYSRKKAVVRDQAINRPDVAKRRQKFIKSAKMADSRKLVFLDETGINGGFHPLTGWAPRGKSAVVCRPTIGRKNQTVIGAMRADGPLAMQSLNGGMRKKNFYSFVAKILGPRLRPGEILVMDNLATHRNQRIINLIESFGVKVCFLPPYSPDLNPIEMVWSTLKHRFRRRFQATIQRVRRAIGGAWRSLRNLNFDKFLPACGYRKAIQSNW